MTDAARYLCIARLDGVDRVLLWEGEDPGPARVVVDAEGFIVTFESEAAARDVARDWRVDPDEPTTYDFDVIQQWCRSVDGVRDPRELLEAWNLLIDMPPQETLFRAADARALDLYDKVFQSCNVPAMTAPGGHFDPVWTKDEIRELKRLLLLGVSELRARFR